MHERVQSLQNVEGGHYTEEEEEEEEEEEDKLENSENNYGVIQRAENGVENYFVPFIKKENREDSYGV